MTKEQQIAIKVLLAQGVTPASIANQLRLPLAAVEAIGRSALGRAVDAAVEVARPAMPKGKPASDMHLCVLATRIMSGKYETAPGGGKLKDGTPAPRSMLDPAYANRTATPAEKRRLRSGL